MSRFNLFIPKQATAANLVFFDLFNGTGSNKDVTIRSVRAIVSGAVAVISLVSSDLFLTYTSSAGTGGTAATVDNSSLTAPGIVRLNKSNSEPDSFITARMAPSGGATAGGVISFTSASTEETSLGSMTGPAGSEFLTDPIVIRQGQGIRVVHGSESNSGNIGFIVSYEYKD